MSNYSWHISEMQVVGYADRLGPETVPTAVTPIFQERAGFTIVMPPYTLKGFLLAPNILGSRADLDRAVWDGKATLLPRARAAKPGRIMWVDEDMKVHYQKATRNGLLRLARHHKRLAERAALLDLEEAMRNINTAISADDTDLDSFAMKALLLKHGPDADLVETLLSTVPQEDQQYVREQMERLSVKFDL